MTRVLYNRWIVAIAGAGLMMTLGTIYSWSLFTEPLMATFGWSATAATSTFSFAIFSLSIGAVLGGRWQDRVTPRTVALTGAALWGLGNFSAGVGTPHLGVWWMYLSYGVVGGFGVGMAYIASTALVTKWFPERRGLGSGIVVTGFGLGAVGYNFIVKSLSSFAAVAAAADARSFPVDAPANVQALMDVFAASGVVFLTAGCGCALFLRNPPIAAVRAAECDFSYTTREMLRTPQFYLLWLMLFCNVAAGISIIGNALPMMQELTGLAPNAVAAVFGGICLLNALGRLFWGAVSDYIGRNRAFALIYGMQICAFVGMIYAHDVASVAIAVAVVLLCFGGGFGTMPSFNADYFGTRHLGANYGAILTAWGAAGIAGPLFAAEVKDFTGSFANALWLVAAMLLLAMVLPVVIKKPTNKPPHAEQQPSTAAIVILDRVRAAAIRSM